MDLSEYPRPQGDNGRGLHWFPTLGQRRPVVDENIPRLADLKVRWLVVWNGLDEPALLVNDHLIKRLTAAGITPVIHVYLRPIAPLDDSALTRLHRLVAFYRDPMRRVDYFQLFYEPNVAGEWADERMPANLVSSFLDAWLPAAQEVINAGGLPGLAPLWPGGDYDDLEFLSSALREIQDRGQGLVLDKAWVALHNYNLGHSIADADDTAGFHRFAAADRVVRERLGRPLPLLTTEGGTRAGDPPYGDGADDVRVASDTVAAYEFMRSAPESYFCYCPWLFGNLLGGGDDRGWEPMAWFPAEGDERPVAAAVRALADFVREPAAAAQPSEPGAREKFFEETQHWVRGPFLEFFIRHGLELCGYPLGEAAVENGIPTQYFQKVVLEEYWPGRIRLRPAGEELVDLHVQVAQSESRVEPLQKEISELQELLRAGMAPAPVSSQSEEASERLAAAEEQVRRLTEDKARLEAVAAASQIPANSGDIAAVAAAEMYKLQTQMAEMKKHVAAARAQTEEALAEKAKAAAELADLQSRICSGEAVAVVNRDALEVAELVKDLESKLAAAEESLAQAEKEKTQTGRHLKATEKQSKGLEEQLATAETQLATVQSQLADVQARLQTSEKDKASMASQMAKLQARVEKAEEMPAGVTVHQLQDRVAQLEAALVDSQTAVQAMMADKPMISQIMDKWKAAQMALGAGADNVRLQGRIDKLEQALAAAQARVKELEAGGAPEPADTAAAEAQAASQAAPAGGPSYQELQARVKDLDAFIEKTQAEMRRLIDQNKQLAGQVAEMEAAGRRGR